MTDPIKPLSHRNIYALFAAAAFILVLLAVVMVLPMFLSTPKGTKMFLHFLNQRIAGELQVGNLYLDWFSGIKVTNIKLTSSSGETALTVEELNTSRGLLRWVWGRGDLGAVSIITPSLTLKLDKTGKSTLDEALWGEEARVAKQGNKPLQNPWPHQLPIGEISIYKGKMTVEAAGAPTALLENLIAHLRHSHKRAPVHIEADAISKLDALEGQLHLNLMVDEAQKIFRGTAEVHHFAITLIDQLLTLNSPTWRGLLTEGLGPTLDLNFSGEGGLKEGQCALKIDTANLKTSLLASAQAGDVSLKEPMLVLCTLQPAVGDQLANLAPVFQSVQFQEAVHLKTEIGSFRAHLDPNSFQLQELIFDATSSSSPFKVTTPHLGTWPVTRLEGKIHAQGLLSPLDASFTFVSTQGTVGVKGTLSPYPEFSPTLTDLTVSDLPLSFIQNIFEIKQPLEPLLGEKLTLIFHAEQETFSVSATTSLLQLPLTHFKKGKMLELQAPTQMTYLLTPEFLSYLLAPARATLTLESLSLPFPQWPLSTYPWRTIATSSQLFIEEASLNRSSYTPQMSLNELRLGITTSHLPKGQFVGTCVVHLPQATGISAALGKEGLPLEFQGNYHLTDQLKMVLDEFVAFVETRYLELRLSAALKKDGRLLLTAPLLARLVIDPHWLASLDPELAALVLQSFSVQFEGSPSELNLEALTLNELVAKGRIHVSPIRLGGEIEASIEELKGDASLNLPKEDLFVTLSGNTKMNDGRTGKVKMALEAHQFLDLSTTSLQSDVTFDVLPSALIALITGKRAYLRLLGPALNMKLTSKFEALKPLQGQLTAHLSSQAVDLDTFFRFSEHSKFNIKGTLGKEGKISFIGEGKELIGSNRTYTAQGDFESLPIPTLTQMLPLQEEVRAQVSALLGEKASGSLAVDLQQDSGPLRLKLESTHTRCAFEGILSPNSLTLTAPLTASIELTPEIGQLVVGHLNPFFLTALRSVAPITLEVQPEGFSFPLPYQENALEVPSATLNLGKLWLKNRGEVGALVGLLKHSPLNEAQELQTWCTPLYFSIAHGVVNCKRMDTLIGSSLQVASWGRVDLPQNKVRMTLAIGAPSLRKLLGIQDIPNSYSLLLPVRGPVNDPYVDSKQATLAIAALLARKEGAAGKIFGGVLDLVSGNLLKQKDIPPPTTQPFPWD
ncbi:MAG: hypothetical protein JSR80_06280 [Verrucomicrobia bacterium]|nr:hypothetical protein [Verrucomicrobiota bacterium]